MTGRFGVTCLRLVLVSPALTVHFILSSFLVVARRHYRYTYARHSRYCTILYLPAFSFYHMQSLTDSYINLLQRMLARYLLSPAFLLFILIPHRALLSSVPEYTWFSISCLVCFQWFPIPLGSQQHRLGAVLVPPFCTTILSPHFFDQFEQRNSFVLPTHCTQ